MAEIQRLSPIQFPALLAGLSVRRQVMARKSASPPRTRVWGQYFPSIEDDWALGVIDSPSVGREAWRRALQACGVVDEDLVEFARQTLATLEHERHHLYDDVPPLVSALEDLKVPLALVTNGASDAQRRGRIRADITDEGEKHAIVGSEPRACRTNGVAALDR